MDRMPLRRILCVISVGLLATNTLLASPQQQKDAAPASGTSASVAPAGAYGEITGTAKSGSTPLPGVSISASNTLTGKKYITSTDVDGTFKIEVTGKGRYVLKAEFSAFAPVTQEVLINDENRQGKADLAMILLSRVKPEQRPGAQQGDAQQNARAIAGAAVKAASAPSAPRRERLGIVIKAPHRT